MNLERIRRDKIYRRNAIIFDAARIIVHTGISILAFANKDKFTGNDKFALGSVMGMNTGGAVWATTDLVRDIHDYREMCDFEKRMIEESQKRTDESCKELEESTTTT